MKKAKRSNRREKNLRKMSPDVPAADYAGMIMSSNQWFKLGLCRTEVAALKKIREEIYERPESFRLAETARALLTAAITHFDVIGPLIFKDAAYSDAEGFILTEVYQLGVIRNLFGLPGSKAAVAGPAK